MNSLENIMNSITNGLKKIKSLLKSSFKKLKGIKITNIKKTVKKLKLKHVLYGITAVILFLLVIIIWSAIIKIRLFSLDATPLFEDRNGNFLTEGSSEYDKLGFWEVPDPIPDRIRESILIIEDKRFYSHDGVDTRSVFRALYNNVFFGRYEGASTIAMQVVRMQFPEKRNMWNKAIEMLAAYFLVQEYGREAVLRHYMKIVPQGNQIYGFAYAARRYFKKPLQDLSWAEAAILSSLPKAPGEMNLFRFAGLLSAIERARLILTLLFQNGKIDEEAFKQSLRQLNLFYTPIKESRPVNSYHYILRILEEKNEVLNTIKEDTYTRSIKTSLDPDIQEFIQNLADFAMLKYRPRGAGNIAIMVADKVTGEILGYIGSQDYFNEEFSGSINYAVTPRSSGSTLKPFLYALGLQTGDFTPASILADLPLHIISEYGEYSTRNFDETFLGPILYRNALANSRNNPTVRVLDGIGLPKVYDYFNELGLHEKENPSDYYGYGIILGGLYVTLEDLIRAFGIIANDGADFKLHWLRADNYENFASDIRYIDESAARQITLFLSDPLARLPSFPRLSTLEFPFPVAIKTGTSQGFRDAWSLAYSSKYIVGVWLGHPENDRMNRIGSFDSSSIVKNILIYLQPEESKGMNEVPFPVPRNHISIKICLLSGELAGEDCPSVSLEYFPETAIPHRLCSVHQKYAIDIETGVLANENTLPQNVQVQSFTVLPPEYAAWGMAKGYGKPPVSNDMELETSISIMQPLNGSRLLIDPETPRMFQTLALKAVVLPVIIEITWIVDGVEYETVEYPYETRWPLDEGVHTFQAKFTRANVFSEVVSIIVSDY